MFTLQRRSAIFHAEYAAPLFQAFSQAWQLQEALHAVLRGYGVGPADIRLERRDGDPTCTANVLSLGAVVSVRLTHVEIFFVELCDPDEARAGLLRTVLGRLGEISGGYRLYSLSLDHHGLLQGLSPLDFIRRFVNPPTTSNLGRLENSSASFFYGASDGRAATSIDLAASSVVPGGLFVKTSAAWQADETSLDAIVSDAGAASLGVLEVLGLAN